jgi:hypothetical protein
MALDHQSGTPNHKVNHGIAASTPDALRRGNSTRRNTCNDTHLRSQFIIGIEEIMDK